MNRGRRAKNNRKTIENNKIIRCKKNMKPVFESDTCSYFIKDSLADSKEICKNCMHSF